MITSLRRDVEPLADDELNAIVRSLLGDQYLEQFDLVIASGGTLSGFTHAYSDLDLYALPREGVAVGGRLESIDNLIVQVNIIDPLDFEQIVDTYRSFRMTREDKAQIHSHLRWRKLGSRLVSGRVIVETDLGTRVRSNLSAEVYRRLVMTCGAIQMGRMLEDAYGSLLTGDLLMLDRASELALVEAIDVVLAGVGDLHYGESILWRRFFTHSATRSHADEAYRIAKGHWENDKSIGPEWAIERCRLASSLASQAILRGWDESVTMITIDHPDANADLVRNPFFHILRLEDAISICGPDKAFRTNATTAEEWLREETTSMASNHLMTFSSVNAYTDPGAWLREVVGSTASSSANLPVE